MSEQIVPGFDRTYALLQTLKKIGFHDSELVVDAVRKIPGNPDPGQPVNVDPNKKFYAVAVVILRNNSSFVIPTFEPWPAEAINAVKPLWASFQNSIQTGKIAPQTLAAAVAKHSFDQAEVEKECREHGVLT